MIYWIYECEGCDRRKVNPEAPIVQCGCGGDIQTTVVEGTGEKA